MKEECDCENCRRSQACRELYSVFVVRVRVVVVRLQNNNGLRTTFENLGF